MTFEAVIVAAGGVFTTTITDVVEVQEAPTVTVNKYCVSTVGLTVIVSVVSLVLHK